MITVINMETLGISEYDLDWENIAVENNILYGIDAAGIYSLEGEFTEQVVIETGELEFSSSRNKVIDRLYLACKAEDITVTVSSTQEGVPRSEPYLIPAESVSSVRTRLLRLNRDVYGGKYFKFTLSTFGSAIIESAEVNPILLRRNI
jgi:hypothetical protein